MELSIFLAIGTIAMLAVMLIVCGCYKIAVWKTIISSVLLTLSGLLGARLMFFIESGRWGGVSFFGAVFFAPIIMLFVGYALRVPVKSLLDMCAPAECIMLALLKVKCYIDGCCDGRLLCVLEDGTAIRFESQIVELINAFIIMIVLIFMIYKGKATGRIYIWYMIIYGVSRFILNWFRDTKPFIIGLPAGNFWSLVSIIIGVVLLTLLSKIERKSESSIKE